MKYIVCVATPSRFAQAEVLRQSCEEHMPGHQFKLVEIKESPTESIYKTVSKTRIETCLELFSQGVKEVIHMGADWIVMAPLLVDIPNEKIFEAFFVPHVVVQLPTFKSKSIEMMRAGVINSDFQVWRKTPEVISFLETILDHLIEGFPARDIFEYEQTWMPFALSTLHALLILHPGYGMAYYNLHERYLNEESKVETAEYPLDELRCFHFSGFDVGKKGISIHDPNRMLGTTEKDLLDDYRKKVLSCAR